MMTERERNRIDAMSAWEVLSIRRDVNNARRRLGLPIKEWSK